MNEATHTKQRLTLRCEQSSTGKLAEFLSQFAKKHKISDEIHNDLHLICEEIFINIVNYAYPDSTPQPVTIELHKLDDNINVTFIDTGIAFNPLTDAAKCKATDDHCEGGMGIHLITGLTDKQAYRRVGQTNVFTLTKHYTKQ